MKKNKEKYGLYLNCKTRKDKGDIYDYASTNVNSINFFIEELTYIVELKNIHIIECLKKQSDKEDYKDRLFFKVDNNNNGFEINNATSIIKYNINEINKDFNTSIWYVINSDDEYVPDFKGKKNDDYYLQENDIIKIGSYKYIISKIYIKNKTLNKREKLINLEPNCKGISKCELCKKPTIKLCNCPEENHIDELINTYKKIHEVKINKNNTVKNYYFNKIPYCEEKRDKNNTCQYYYSMKYKYDEDEADNLLLKYKDNIKIEDEEEILNFFNIEIPENKDYMILESIEEKNNDQDLITKYAKKSIHVVELNEEDIKIGREEDNDIILNDKKASKYHAIIKYDKLNGKLKIINLSKHSGTLAFIHDKKIQITEKPFFFQIHQTFFEAQLMTLNYFINNKKNDYSQYPINFRESKNK